MKNISTSQKQKFSSHSSCETPKQTENKVPSFFYCFFLKYLKVTSYILFKCNISKDPDHNIEQENENKKIKNTHEIKSGEKILEHEEDEKIHHNQGFALCKIASGRKTLNPLKKKRRKRLGGGSPSKLQSYSVIFPLHPFIYLFFFLSLSP